MAKKTVKIDKAFIDAPSGTLKPHETTVKNLANKKIKPSVFIGSATESHSVAKQVQSCFDQTLFEVDTWKMDIFGQKDGDGDALTNAEQLKNFTDIYDYAIFVFTPDDKLISQTRTELKNGEPLKAYATRHNVVFEFGLFLGRLGAKNSFILYDEDVREFIDYFFTDLKENIDDQLPTGRKERKFSIEAHGCKGKFLEHVRTKGKKSAFDKKELAVIISKLSQKMLQRNQEISLGFLPSTSLAKGYYKNFLGRILNSLNHIHFPDSDGHHSLKLFRELAEKDTAVRKMMEILFNKQTTEVRIVIPDDLVMAQYEDFKPLLDRPEFETGSIPIMGERPKSVYYYRESANNNGPFVIYDIPTTMNSSIEAIHMTTDHEEIRELLSEKERRNFVKAIQHIIHDAASVPGKERIKDLVRLISWEEFIDETRLDLPMAID